MKILKPLKQRTFSKNIYGFDIETYGRKNEFYCASVWNPKYQRVFFDKEELIHEFTKHRYRNVFVVATNLLFDFMGTYFGRPEEKKFKYLYRGSQLIFAKSYIKNNTYNLTYNKEGCVTFIDTYNYAKMSVAALGKILGTNKLKSPACLGRLPDNEKEKRELVIYNLRDSEVSQKFMSFLFDSFSQLGATPQKTIASTTMNLFRTKYLNTYFFRHSIDDLKTQFKAYYGGRTEAFKRGVIEDYYYYDFNSLYPSVMLNDFPDPNTLRRNKENTKSYINSFEGISKVEIHCPDNIPIPLLPYRTEFKLLFPKGTFTGWYSHVELRKALEIGYVLKRVYRTLYCKETCSPFREFVTDLYKKRMAYKKDNNNMQFVIKLVLNSLYGKFGQRFWDRDNYISADTPLSELHKYDYIERIGNFFRVKNAEIDPPVFTVPMWALYTTAMARLKLYDVLQRSDPVYCDTDSIITRDKYVTNNELGRLKLEMNIAEGIIVKPKMYALKDDQGRCYVKIKGIGKQVTYPEFKKFIKNPVILYDKFVKFKEAMKRNLTPNEIIPVTKHLNLEDDKRIWPATFNPKELQLSIPKPISDLQTLPQLPVLQPTIR